MESNIAIVSNNCIAGFIYNMVLNTKYASPFIWNLFSNPDDFIDLVSNWNKTDLSNIVLDKNGVEFKNNFYLLIDGKYKVDFIHVFFDKNANNPIVKDNNLYYNKPWEYIVNKYLERLKRMYTINKLLFVYFEPNLKCSKLSLLPQICQQNRFKCLIFTNDNLQENEFVRVLPSKNYNIPKDICNVYRQEILDICNK